METNGNGSKQAQISRGLGWLSLGLGFAEVLVPGALARVIGVPERRGLIRLLGFREIASGVAILSQRHPAGGLWSRVGGDALDLALLGGALASHGTKRGRVTGALAAVAGVTALDVYCSGQAMRSSATDQALIHLERSLTINRPAGELYKFWRNFQNLPSFMNHLESVVILDDRRSHWRAKAPAGMHVEWDAEITEDKPNERIAWRSLPDATVENSGDVRFERATGGRGTVIRVRIDYWPPAGRLGATVAKLFGEGPDKQVAVDLRRFKQLMETGEVARTEGQSAGRSSSTSKRYDDLVRQ